MKMIERIKNIILKPGEEWNMINQEEASVKEVITNYLLILAFIPAFCQFIYYGIIGVQLPVFGYMEGVIVLGIRYAAITYISIVVAVFVAAYVIDALAPNFGSEQDYNKSLLLVIYSYIPVFITAIFFIIPYLGFFSILGLYGLYIFYQGIGVMKKTPADRIAAYFIVSILVAVAILLILWYVLGKIFLLGTAYM
jgi:hypothetical protein